MTKRDDIKTIQNIFGITEEKATKLVDKKMVNPNFLKKDINPFMNHEFSKVTKDLKDEVDETIGDFEKDMKKPD